MAKYRSLVSEMLAKQKRQLELTPEKLRASIGSLISYERGDGLLRQRYASEGEVKGRLLALDYLYLSLAERIPKEADPLNEGYNLSQRGIRFGRRGSFQYVKYNGGLGDLLRLEKTIIQTDEDIVLEKGSSIYNWFKNNRFARSSQRTNPLIVEALSQDRINSNLEALANATEEPERLLRGDYNAVFFAETGVFLLRESADDYDFLSYRPETQKMVAKNLKDFSRYQKFGRKAKTNDMLSDMKEEAALIMAEEIQKKLNQLDPAKLSNVEQSARELKDSYGIEVRVKNLRTSDLLFEPAITDKEMQSITKLYSSIARLSGKYIQTIEKERGPKSWNNTLEGALFKTGQRFAELVSRTVQEPIDLGFLVNKSEKLVLDECDLLSLQHDFPKYLEMIVGRLSHNIFFQLPKEQRIAYSALTDREVGNQMEALRAYGVQPKGYADRVRLLYFMKDATEFQMAEIDGRDCTLTDAKKVHFDRIFATKKFIE